VNVILAVHGGAGNGLIRKDTSTELEKAYRHGIASALRAGEQILRDGGTSVTAVEAAVQVLEDDELFNAGKGSVFTEDGGHQLDASIMRGADLAAGAVAGLRTVRNPISAARLVMESTQWVLLAGEGAEDLAIRHGLPTVPQDSFLFSERYEDNIRFGADHELTDTEVDTLIERAAMTEEVARFPEGKRTVVGERGVTLSGGQRQRTCIARALARDPKVLVLDDCLSAVDTETERQLLASLSAAGVGRTVLVSAHRLSTVRDADQILVLSARGAPEALGTHDELLAAGGWYAETWERQQRRETLREEVLVLETDAAQPDEQLIQSSRNGGQA
jgi:ABC-type multidrug transport system ATPase subunit